jgi:membrane protein implicated in regulation of membrane protease activity
MTRQPSSRVLVHVVLGVAALGGGLWLLAQAEERMSGLPFLLLLYALAEGAWALGAYQNQRDYARNPRRPAINEMRGLVGAEAVVTRACNPRGQVRLDGALWLANGTSAGQIPERARVRVTGYHGLVLEVEPSDAHSTDGEVV